MGDRHGSPPVTGRGAYAIPCPDLSERFEEGMLDTGMKEENLAIRRKVASARKPKNAMAPLVWDGGDAGDGRQDKGHMDMTEGIRPTGMRTDKIVKGAAERLDAFASYLE